MSLLQGDERWMIMYTQALVERVRQTMLRQVTKAYSAWDHTCWHLANRRFACEADACAAVEREVKGKPIWLDVHTEVITHAQYEGKGRPRKDGTPSGYHWQVLTTVSINFH